MRSSPAAGEITMLRWAIAIVVAIVGAVTLASFLYRRHQIRRANEMIDFAIAMRGDRGSGLKGEPFESEDVRFTLPLLWAIRDVSDERVLADDPGTRSWFSVTRVPADAWRSVEPHFEAAEREAIALCTAEGYLDPRQRYVERDVAGARREGVRLDYACKRPGLDVRFFAEFYLVEDGDAAWVVGAGASDDEYGDTEAQLRRLFASLQLQPSR